MEAEGVRWRDWEGFGGGDLVDLGDRTGLGDGDEGP